MKIKTLNLKTINIFLFVLMFACRSFTDAIFVSKGITSNIWINLKYFIVIFAILLNGIYLVKNKRKFIFTKELKNVLFVSITLIVISCIEILINDKLNNITFEEIFKLILPIIYVFLIINTLEFEEIYSAMRITLIMSIIAYIIEIGSSNFSISNIISMNFENSYSPFESHFASGTSIAMCTFFLYYRKDKLFTILSFAFAIFTFKRLSVLFAILLMFLPMFINVDKEVGKKLRIFFKICFIALPLLYYIFLLPSSSEFFYKVIGESQSKFTMGRSNMLSYINGSNFKSFGLGSSTIFIGRSLEMDLIKIYIETGIIGLVVLVSCYWECAGKTRYTYIYMLFQFINLVTSHSLENSFNWILVFMTIGCITYKQRRSLLYLKYRRKKDESRNCYNQ